LGIVEKRYVAGEPRAEAAYLGTSLRAYGDYYRVMLLPLRASSEITLSGQPKPRGLDGVMLK
jgi:hypothetical protein